jgi:hypothetical protein
MGTKINKALSIKGSLGLILIFLFTTFMSIAPIFAKDDCQKTYPNPEIKFDHQDAEGRIYIPVVNWAAYDNELFRKAPDLPPCGANTESARTWVDVYNADTNAHLYGFCSFVSNNDLKVGIWFKPPTFKGRAYIIIKDRACQKNYKSNIISWGPQDNCQKTYPNPVIKFDHQDAEGRVYIPVFNWKFYAYDAELFRKAPDLPACGANTNSARTWVDIYNADTNVKIYGFCALNSYSELKSLWFKPSTPKGRVYIIINDRACRKTYKSNIVNFP